jgi:hypothetical protein
MAQEDDPFAEFLSQETPAPVEGGGGGGEIDVGMQLKLLVESSRRQEELLGKVCSLLVGLDAKMGSIANSQNRLEDKLSQPGAMVANPGTAGSPPVAQAARASTAVNRGQMICPPGKTPEYLGGSFTAPPPAPTQTQPQTAQQVADQQRMSAERIQEERRRIEEEGRRRAEELARNRELEQQRRREEAERQRLEEERRKEAEKQRKAALENKTAGLMAGLTSGAGGANSLFDDDDKPEKPKGGGLFDDD